jgi:hypothetical protein
MTKQNRDRRKKMTSAYLGTGHAKDRSPESNGPKDWTSYLIIVKLGNCDLGLKKWITSAE